MPGSLALLVITLKVIYFTTYYLSCHRFLVLIMSCLEDTYTFSFSEKLYNIKTYGSNLKPYTKVDVELNPAGYEIYPLLLDMLQ